MLLRFREVGEAESFAPWVRELRGKSGAYLIQAPSDINGWPIIAYVGESHRGRLYKTLARHFQHWKGPTSGPTYDRRTARVAVLVCEPGRAVELQNRLIARYLPPDNVLGKPSDETPF